MKRIFATLAIAGSVLAATTTAFAQEIPAEPAVAGGDIRSPSPRIMDPDRPGYFQLNVGPSFALGLESDTVMYDIVGAYNYNLSDRITAKLMGDFNLGTGSDAARLINLAVGADIFMNEVRMSYGIPYLTADIGYAMARNQDDKTLDAPSLGAGAGFKLAAEALNVDINLHYSIMTDQLEGRTPSVLGLRAGLAF